VKSRSVEDVLIAIVDGLKGFPEAITAVFPQAQVQTCVVHLIHHSLAFVSYKDRKAVAAALKQIYKAKDADAGKAALEAFDEAAWGRKYPATAQSCSGTGRKSFRSLLFPTTSAESSMQRILLRV
jgi:putative transposase